MDELLLRKAHLYEDFDWPADQLRRTWVYEHISFPKRVSELIEIGICHLATMKVMLTDAAAC